MLVVLQEKRAAQRVADALAAADAVDKEAMEGLTINPVTNSMGVNEQDQTADHNA